MTLQSPRRLPNPTPHDSSLTDSLGARVPPRFDSKKSGSHSRRCIQPLQRNSLEETGVTHRGVGRWPACFRETGQPVWDAVAWHAFAARIGAA